MDQRSGSTCTHFLDLVLLGAIEVLLAFLRELQESLYLVWWTLDKACYRESIIRPLQFSVGVSEDQSSRCLLTRG